MDFAQKINDFLIHIDRQIELDTWEYKGGILKNYGGSTRYFLNRYLCTANTTFLDLALSRLEQLVSDTNMDTSDTPYLSISAPKSASGILIDQFINNNVLDSTERQYTRDWISMMIDSTTEDELRLNQHDLFYGSIGKAVIAMNHDAVWAKPFVKRIATALIDNQKNTDKGTKFWLTPDPFSSSFPKAVSLNLGIPHGMLGILLFLIRCNEKYGDDFINRESIAKSIEWLMDLLDQENNRPNHMYADRHSGSGRLAWCYGDLAIAFTLLRYFELSTDARARNKATELIEAACHRTEINAGLQHYPKYNYYDMCLCHGTAGIAYMWKKIYELTRDERHHEQAQRWIIKTLDNLEVYLPQLATISTQENEFIDTSMGFLNGLSGVGLVMMSFIAPQFSDWDTILLLDKPTE